MFGVKIAGEGMVDRTGSGVKPETDRSRLPGGRAAPWVGPLYALCRKTVVGAFGGEGRVDRVCSTVKPKLPKLTFSFCSTLYIHRGLWGSTVSRCDMLGLFVVAPAALAALDHLERALWVLLLELFQLFGLLGLLPFEVGDQALGVADVATFNDGGGVDGLNLE